MKNLFYSITAMLLPLILTAQTVNGPYGYKVIDLGNNGVGDYTNSLILLHEMYNGTRLPYNNAVGTITATRGSQVTFNRTDIAYINTSSAYGETYGSLQYLYSDQPWKLKTCLYNGKKYLALDVPYHAAFHDRGFQFAGWTNSSGENLKCVNYIENGQPVNQNILTNITDFSPNLAENHDVHSMNISGSVTVGNPIKTNNSYKLNVAGSVRANEIVVNTTGADFVFDEKYQLCSLSELEKFIKKNRHLPEIASANQMKDHGMELGSLNKQLLQKVEELTLYLIDQNKLIRDQQLQIDVLQQQAVDIEGIKKQLARVTGIINSKK